MKTSLMPTQGKIFLEQRIPKHIYLQGKQYNAVWKGMISENLNKFHT